MKKHKSSKILLLVLSLFLLISCQTVADCIVGIRPNLIEKELKTGIVSMPYDETIHFEMLNVKSGVVPYIISSFTIEGSFPQGINYNVRDNNTIIFTGIPVVPGTYEFTVNISVRPTNYNEDGSDDLCGNGSSKKYKITIR